MKKLIALLLAALMLCGMLAACGSSEEKKSTEAPTTEAPATEPEETEPEETEPEETEPEEIADNAVTFGAWDGNVYTNEYIGFSLELDENWTVMTAEELQELPENVEELLQGTAMAETMKNYTQIADMQAQNLTDMSSVSVLYQVKDAATLALGSLLTEEALIDATLAQSSLLTSTYESMGMEDITFEKVQVEFMGEEHYAMQTSAKLAGLDYYILQIVSYDCGEYGVFITCAAFGEEVLEDLLALFQPLN